MKQLQLFARCEACDKGYTAKKWHRVECKVRRKDGRDAIPIQRSNEKGSDSDPRQSR